jgi:fatty-acyl-CoA synthase
MNIVPLAQQKTIISGSVAHCVSANLASHRADEEFIRLAHYGKPHEVQTYRGLIDYSARWRSLYRRLGLSAGDRVIVILEHSVDLYAAYLGALLNGAVPSMFYFPSVKFSEEEYFKTIGVLISRTRAKCVVCFPQLASKLLSREGDALHGAQVVGPQQLTPERDASAFETRRREDVAFLQFSSGTTGVKKGVAVTHGALLAHVEAYADVIQLRGSDRIASWLPLYHDMGLITCFFIPLLTMTPLIVMSPFEWVQRPGAWLQMISEHKATLAWLPNFAFSLMARVVSESELHGVSLSSIRGLVNCSEPLMAESLDSFAERFAPCGFDRRSFASSYAMAENTFAVTSGGFSHPLKFDWIDAERFQRHGVCCEAALDSQKRMRMVSSGRPLPDTIIKIVDRSGNMLPDRHVGEIIIRSPALMQGYDNNPEDTFASLSDDFFHTGDLGYLAEGQLYVTGRLKDLIIVGGRNFYPQDIEATVGKLEGVVPGRVVAYGRREEALGTEMLVVLAETTENDVGKRVEIEQAIREVVAALAGGVPLDVSLGPPRSLVKSSSGKLSRQASIERYLEAGIVRPLPPAKVANSAEDGLRNKVRDCVKAILLRRHYEGYELSGDHASLIRSGLLDSLSIADLLASVEAAVGRAIPVSALSNPENFDSINAIVSALSNERSVSLEPFDFTSPVAMTSDRTDTARRRMSFWTLVYRLVFRMKGVRCGAGLRVLGPVHLESVGGNFRNVQIGDDVTIMPGVHLKLRDNGAIILHNEVKLDTNVRLVAANDARITMGARSTVGMGSIFNAGSDIDVGAGGLISAYCLVNSSDHKSMLGTPMREQAYIHTPVRIFEGVWLGAHVVVMPGSRMGPGAVAAAASIITGDIPPNAIVQGQPARVIKFRT